MDNLVKTLVRSNNGNYAGVREVIREELTMRAADLLEALRPLVAESMVASKDCASVTKMRKEGLPPGTAIDEKLPKARAGKRRADQ